MKRIILFQRYNDLAPSSRNRFSRYKDQLATDGFSLTMQPLLPLHYITTLYASGKRLLLAVLFGYLRRIKYLLTCKKPDLIIIEKELFPYLPAWIELLLLRRFKSYWLDYDDAVYLNYQNQRFAFIRWLLKDKHLHLAKHANRIICGNQTLANYFQHTKTPITISPTAVTPIKSLPNKPPAQLPLKLVWAGTPQTYPYLVTLKTVLEPLLKKKQITLTCIGINEAQNQITGSTTIEWSPLSEDKHLQAADLGLSPLPDNAWTQAKCGFKLLKYLSNGVPALASPIGIQANLIQNGHNGLLCDDIEAWKETLQQCIANLALLEQWRQNTLALPTEFTTTQQYPQLLKLLQGQRKKLR